MRIALIIIIGIHAIINLMGFLNVFGLANLNVLSQLNSKVLGLVFLLTFLLSAFTMTLLVIRSRYWWLSGFLTVIISQVVFINYWSELKIGTIVNVIIFIPLIVAYASSTFSAKIAEERKNLFSNSALIREGSIGKESLNELPSIVQKWLIHSGAMDGVPISNVYLTQELKLKMKPEASEWNDGRAEQYFTIQPPAFNWSISTQMNSLVKVTGRDKFENGKGEMIIKLFSLIPVANAKNHDKVNQASLQRYLAEIVWFPSASLSPYIKWEYLDENSAKATMEYKGTKGSGVFYFDEKGTFKKFVAMRYHDANAKEATEWTVIATKTEERNGVNIPVECEASWRLESGKWTWLKVKIRDIRFNVSEIPLL